MPMVATTLLPDALLPCTMPLETAVEAGVFGVCADGTLRPSPEEIAAITAEHACGMLDLLCQLKHLEQCLKDDLHPISGRPLRGSDREERRSGMARQARALSADYSGRLQAYAAAFGWNAAAALEEFLQDMIKAPESVAIRQEQQRLF